MLFFLFSLFLCAIGPILDNLVVNYSRKVGKSYGHYRMWGAISFALAAWLMGKVGERLSLHYLFYLFAGALMVVALLCFRLPSSTQSARGNILIGNFVLFRNPSYIMILFITFCVLGPMIANNNFFGLFYQFIGGTIAGVGLCFLIGAGSEAPFMWISGSWIRIYGQRMVLLLAATMSAVQYFVYALAPPVSWIPWITVLQGFSIGMFIPASLQVAQQLAPSSVKHTAVSMYSAMSSAGNVFFVILGGFLLDYFPVTAVYWFFASSTLLGILFIWLHPQIPRR